MIETLPPCYLNLVVGNNSLYSKVLVKMHITVRIKMAADMHREYLIG